MSENKAQALPPSLPPRVGPLNTAQRVRAELARVYKDARQGTISTQDASRLAFILTALYKVIEGSDLERRIEQLEKAHAQIENSPRSY